MRYQSGSAGVGVDLYRSMPGWLILDDRAEISSRYPSGFITSDMRATIKSSSVVTFDFYWSRVTRDGRQILNV